MVLVTYLGLKHGVNPDVPAAKPWELPVLDHCGCAAPLISFSYITQPSAGAIPARS